MNLKQAVTLYAARHPFPSDEHMPALFGASITADAWASLTAVEQYTLFRHFVDVGRCEQDDARRNADFMNEVCVARRKEHGRTW